MSAARHRAGRQPLRGVSVLVTRPAGQAEALCRLIEEKGGEALRFPALALEPVARESRAAAPLRGVRGYDLAIFVSANAAQFGLRLLQGTWPAQVPVAAVGRATAAALTAAGVPVAVVPAARYDSEALLAHPALQRMAGKRVLIVRGAGGRELLREMLSQRGARVDYAEVYRRTLPNAADVGVLLDQWRGGGVSVVTATSEQILNNLCGLLGEQGRELLLATPLVVISQRVAELARTLGFQHTAWVASEASDAGIVAAIEQWREATA